MTRRLIFGGAALGLALLLPLIGFSLEVDDARTVGCLPKGQAETASAACAGCHKDAPVRYQTSQNKACTPYCMSCHKKAEMDRHHTVGTALPMTPDNPLHVNAANQIVCTTCHDMSRARYDSVRWKATSLFDRLFRSESRYKTYFLAMRNDAGQLCLTCH